MYSKPPQLHNIHCRTRSHLVYECKHSIVEVFALNKLAQPQGAVELNKLLFQGRFICCLDGPETDQRHFRPPEITENIFRKYLANIKMRGNYDENFFDSINEVFICLVTSAMCHCLKAWTTGIYVEPPNMGDFKYHTTVTTWDAHPMRTTKASKLTRGWIPDGMQRQMDQVEALQMPHSQLTSSDDGEDHDSDKANPTADIEANE
ncbi:hypothetical protein L211DRAFT_852720 [Terfezia boudieri ATCC MYA-4762]|uniref:DUF6532 domain-containing protein n=1 Tax=Terfezia boudieri ATCC MYA-4762 TaxID=1051890 RepID=A0A3N4LAX3_9PEZI|nr:hypothetical protein L211DRAFT_852720 [Terfezia boudieri ATCC MYA-4762]